MPKAEITAGTIAIQGSSGVTSNALWFLNIATSSILGTATSAGVDAALRNLTNPFILAVSTLSGIAASGIFRVACWGTIKIANGVMYGASSLYQAAITAQPTPDNKNPLYPEEWELIKLEDV